MTERKGSIIGKASAEFLMNRARIEVSDPWKNLDVARRHLQTGSGIVLFNHFKGDFFIWAKFIKENLTPLDNAAAMVAMKYLDPQRGIAGKTLSFMFPEWEKSHGVKVLPIVQAKDYDIYPEHKRINMTSVIKARDFLKTPGRVLAFSPEGTRSLSGGLGEAEEGVDLILKMNKGSIAIPVAAESATSQKATLYRSKTLVHVGEIFTNKDIELDQELNPDTKKKDLIMQRIAKLLPEQNRGFYR